MNTLNTLDLAQQMRGMVTVASLQSRLGLNRRRVIYLIHKLRKKGFVKTKYQSNKVRVYYISPENVSGGVDYIDILNQHSPFKLLATETYKIHGRDPSIEETFLYALSKKTVRYTIASIGLFRKITDWSLLYKLAKEKDLLREVAALYEVARKYLPKLRRMPKRFRNLTIPKKDENYHYIVKGLKSRDFTNIEKKWKVYLPLNHSDLREYKGEGVS